MRTLTLLHLFFILSLSHAFAFQIKGQLDTVYNTTSDQVYVGLIWHSDDGPGYNPSYATSIAVVKKGKFKLKVNELPAESSKMNLGNSEVSVAYIVLFKDVDGDQRFTKADKTLGVCERHCMVYVSGDLVQDLAKIEEQKGTKMELWRRLGTGLQFCKVIRPDEHGFELPFDDLVKAKKTKILISTGANGKKPKAPNWT